MTMDPYSSFEELCYEVDGRVRKPLTTALLPCDDTLLCEMLASRELLDVIQEESSHIMNAADASMEAGHGKHNESSSCLYRK